MKYVFKNHNLKILNFNLNALFYQIISIIHNQLCVYQLQSQKFFAFSANPLQALHPKANSSPLAGCSIFNGHLAFPGHFGN